jgi:Raf kinase inhibitor-like YbhB/YbcL family protein
MHHFPLAMALIVLLLAGGCEQQQTGQFQASSKNGSIMKLTSSEIKDGSRVANRFTADGEDLSPPLSWSGAPDETKSFALICDDPDAPSPRRPAAEPWVHWVIYNIPQNVSELPSAMKRVAESTNVPGARQGVNSWSSDNIGYRGPAPPPGSGKHRYVFKLYALDTVLDLPAGATKRKLLDAMSGHIVAEAQLVGTFER